MEVMQKKNNPVLYIPGVYSEFDAVQYKWTFKQTKKMPTRTPPPSSFLSQEVNNLENLWTINNSWIQL